MAEVTPLHDANVADMIRDCMKNRSPHQRRHVIGLFINYVPQEDAHFCVVPKHATYSGQADVCTVLAHQVKALSSLAAIVQFDGYHRRIGKVFSWKAAGFGVIREAGVDYGIYVHISDVLGDTVRDIPEGTHIEYDVVDGPKGPKR